MEKEVAEIKQILAVNGKPANWLEQVTGSMKDDPDFGEVLRLGREIRKADRPAD